MNKREIFMPALLAGSLAAGEAGLAQEQTKTETPVPSDDRRDLSKFTVSADTTGGRISPKCVQSEVVLRAVEVLKSNGGSVDVRVGGRNYTVYNKGGSGEPTKDTGIIAYGAGYDLEDKGADGSLDFARLPTGSKTSVVVLEGTQVLGDRDSKGKFDGVPDEVFIDATCSRYRSIIEAILKYVPKRKKEK